MGIGKIELEVAKKVADRVVRHVAPSMSRVEVAGSIRRCKSVVGDVEIVGIPCDRAKMLNLLSDVGQTIKPGVPGVVPWQPKLDAKYVRVRLDEGMNLDVFIARPENWGGLFLMRTGSASGHDGNAFSGFVPAVFHKWKVVSKGGRMTNAMPTTPSGDQIILPEEQDFFDLLGMDFVPPHERVDSKAVKRYSRKA